MTLNEFKLLDLNEQAQATWDHGILMGFREDPEYHMVLYRIDDFYIELHYHTSQNEITAIESFISEERLTPYLDKIDITELFQKN
jgi:hypothetical protein